MAPPRLRPTSRAWPWSLLSVNPALKPGDLRGIIQQSAVDLGPDRWDDHYGWGRLNVDAAVTLAQSWTPYTPTPTATATASPTP